MSNTKGWDWSKNEDNHWLIPAMECSYLAERWQSKGFHQFLDLGSGLGRHSIYMAHKGLDVTAMDLSDYGINHLNEWAKKENLKVNTFVGNMLNLPFEDQHFDCIMAYNVIYHTDTLGFKDSLEEIKRVLKPNGELFLTLLSKNTWGFVNSNNSKFLDENTILRDEHETEKDVPHFYVNIEDIKKYFKGFDYVKLPVETCDYNMEKPEYYSKHWMLILRKK